MIKKVVKYKRNRQQCVSDKYLILMTHIIRDYIIYTLYSADVYYIGIQLAEVILMFTYIGHM